jgi:lysophospholipase L1-like esterase
VTRHRLAGFVALAAGLVVALVGAAPAGGATPLPSSIASTGDSITRAYNTGGLFTDNPASSWSTGTTASVNSHYLRLKALQPTVTVTANNDAKTGAKMVDLDGQLATAASQHAAYVTILMGANDVCTSSVSTMTPVSTFQTQFQTALSHFTAADPGASVFVSSIPNIYNLWQIEHTNGSARFIWAIGSICQSMLANPTSTSAADNARRATVQAQNVAFNGVLSSVCAGYAKCRFDGNAVYNTTFTTSDVNTRDYFHPSTSGQAKLAAVTWSAGFWGP